MLNLYLISYKIMHVKIFFLLIWLKNIDIINYDFLSLLLKYFSSKTIKIDFIFQEFFLRITSFFKNIKRTGPHSICYIKTSKQFGLLMELSSVILQIVRFCFLYDFV
jgi:hypothetical protein